MKTIYAMFLLFCILTLKAQDGFNVRILDENALPTQITLKTDNSLDLRFKSSDLESIFEK